MRRLALLLPLLLASAAAQVPAAPTADIRTVAAAGLESGTRYTNWFFGLTVDTSNAKVTLNPLVNDERQRARLVQVFSTATDPASKFTFAVLADAESHYPQIKTSADYVRSVRLQLEKQGLTTVEQEFPITISGVRFTACVLQVSDGAGRKHFRALFTTFRNGYILSFDAEAATRVDVLVRRLVTFGK
jgi:hypothetical protein